jgi:hypothetical protein
MFARYYTLDLPVYDARINPLSVGVGRVLGHSIKQFLRGGVSTPHVVVSTWLGACLASVVSASNSLGLLLSVLVLTSVIRVNWGVLAVATLVTKTLFWLGAGVIFSSGQWLLTGPLAESWMNVASLPVLAWFGLEYPLVSGALLWTLPMTVAISALLMAGLGWLRRTATSLEGSSKYQSFASNPVGRWVLQLTLGVSASNGIVAALDKHIGFWRWKGAAVAGVVILFAGFTGNQWANNHARGFLSSALAAANGATVDIEQAEFNIWRGRLNLEGLAIADSENLATNLLAANQLSMTVSWADLLSKQVRVDEITVRQAQSGSPRATKGQLTGPIVNVPEESVVDSESIEDYLTQAKEWKERLAQFKEWLDRWESGDQATQPGPADPDYETWLDEQIQNSGYASVVHEPLARRYWQTNIDRVYIDALTVEWLAPEALAIEMTSLSSQPAQNTAAPRLLLTSASDNIALDVIFESLVGSGGNSRIQGYFNNIDYQAIKAQLNSSVANKVNDGIVNIALSGDFNHRDTGELNLLLAAQLSDASLMIKGEPIDVERFDIPVLVQGAFANPSIRVDKSVVESQVKDLAKDAVKSKVESKLKDKVQDKLKGLFKR